MRFGNGVSQETPGAFFGFSRQRDEAIRLSDCHYQSTSSIHELSELA